MCQNNILLPEEASALALSPSIRGARARASRPDLLSKAFRYILTLFQMCVRLRFCHQLWLVSVLTISI